MKTAANQDPIRFTLPNGIVIEAALNGDKADNDRGEWKSIDIMAAYPDGTVDILCAVDWETGRGTSALVFDARTEDPIFTHHYNKMN